MTPGDVAAVVMGGLEVGIAIMLSLNRCAPYRVIGSFAIGLASILAGLWGVV